MTLGNSVLMYSSFDNFTSSLDSVLVEEPFKSAVSAMVEEIFRHQRENRPTEYNGSTIFTPSQWSKIWHQI
jgi:hypothetical protein